MDALVAYLQALGTFVDIKDYQLQHKKGEGKP
jgi:cbb3-type cytochrome oxidase cytochrome c subunit